MRKNRLFFSMLISATMMLSLFSLPVLAQPSLPDNPYQDFSGDDSTTTKAFAIEIEHPQYWQGRPISIRLKKVDDAVKLVEDESVLFSIATNLFDAYNPWIGLDYGKDSVNVTIELFDSDGTAFDVDNHVEVINALAANDYIEIRITPAAPHGPIGFYQPGNHYVRLGFFIDPVVDVDNPELKISNIQTFLVPDGKTVYKEIRDDAIFFEGDTFEATFRGLPLGFVEDGYIINQFALGSGADTLATSFEFVRVHYVVCKESMGDCEIAPIFTENNDTYKDFQGVLNNEVTVSGTLNPALGQVYLGYVIELSTVPITTSELKDVFTKEYIVMGLWEDDSMGMGVYSHAPDYFSEYDWPNPVIINYGLTPIEGITYPDLKTYSDLYNTDKVFPIEKEGVGTISFDPGLNLIDNADQLALLGEAFSLEQDATNKKLTAKVDTSTLSFLSNIGATIVFENAMETLGFDDVDAENFLNYVDIQVYDGDVLVEDINDYVDFDNSSYNPITDQLSLRVFHFTEYVVSAAEDEETTPPVEDDEEEEVTTPPVDEDDEEDVEVTPPDVEEEKQALLPDMSDNSFKTIGWVVLLLGALFVMFSTRKKRLNK